MSDEEFERLVAEGIDAIPERFLLRIENVVVVVEDLPSEQQLLAHGIEDPYELLGLYEGVPVTERGETYGVGGLLLPDKITVFKLPILAEAEGDPEKIRDVVRDTVWHEIGHYFGWDDDALYEREDRGTNRSK
jgi:predicted Zn-dependent protease with MMP-like domain